MNITSHHEDFANLLLILLKFLLVIIIGLNRLMVQLGMSPSGITGVVNATPPTQVSQDGTFPISLYPVVYSPHDDYDVFLNAWACWKETPASCPLDSIGDLESQGKPSPGWISLGSQFIELQIRQGADRAERSFVSKLFSLSDGNGLGSLVSGTYSMIYNVQFNSKGSGPMPPEWVRNAQQRYDGVLGRRVPEDQIGRDAFKVEYRPKDQGEWRLPAVQIVRGRTAPAPSTVGALADGSGAFQLAPVDPEGRFSVQPGTPNRFKIEDYQGIEDDSFEGAVEILTTVTSVDKSGRTFNVDGIEGSVAVAGDTQFLRCGGTADSYSPGEFGDLAEGHRIYFRLKSNGNPEDPLGRIAGLVRYGPKVVASVGFVVLPNLPPRGIFRDVDRSGDQVVLLNFPYDVYREPLRQGGEFVWFFDLNDVIIDPDGIDGTGEPSVKVQSIRPGAKWASGYELVNDPKEGISAGSLLKIDLNQVLPRQELEVRVADDLQQRTIQLVIDYDREPAEMVAFQEILREIKRR